MLIGFLIQVCCCTYIAWRRTPISTNSKRKYHFSLYKCSYQPRKYNVFKIDLFYYSYEQICIELMYLLISSYHFMKLKSNNIINCLVSRFLSIMVDLSSLFYHVSCYQSIWSWNSINVMEKVYFLIKMLKNSYAK